MKKTIALFLALACLTTSLVLADTVTGNVYTEQIRQAIQDLGIRDVAPTDWAASSLINMTRSGLIPPVAPGEIRPNAPTTPADGVTVFARVMGLVSQDATPAQAATALGNAGIVDPAAVLTEGRTFTRGDMLMMMAKALNVQPSTRPCPFVDVTGLTAEQQALLTALYDARLLAGYEDRTVRFDLELSRSELAAFVERILARMPR